MLSLKRPNEVRLDPICLAWLNALEAGETKKKVNAMLDTLKERADAGDHVQRSLWPQILAYEGINNLWRYEIDREMRAAYTVKREGDVFTVRIIEIFPDHKSYERRFRY